jgi:hypothetical protein
MLSSLFIEMDQKWINPASTSSGLEWRRMAGDHDHGRPCRSPASPARPAALPPRFRPSWSGGIVPHLVGAAQRARYEACE